MVVRLSKHGFRPVAILLAVLLPTTVWAELSVTLDRNPVRVNETFVLDIKTDEVGADEPNLDWPDGIQMLRRNTISSRSIVNGKISAERTWRYSLVARQPGEYVLPAITIGKDKSAPLAVSVEAADSKPLAASGNQPIVLKANVDQRTVYAQQQLILTVQLLRNVPLRFAQLTEPQLPTALVQKLGEDSEYETRINGVAYMVIERRYAIFPQQAGELVIDPIRFQADVSSERQLSLFGAFNETQPVSMETQPISITVKPPEQNSDWLPAQTLSLSDIVSAGPYRVGEPLTWTVTLTADGALPAQLPALAPNIGVNVGKQWRIYPDQPQDKVEVIASGVRTTRQQKFALVPLNDGEQTLPTLTIPWWRLSDGSAQLASLATQTLSVETAPASATQSRNAPILAPATQPTDHANIEPNAPAQLPPAIDKPDWWPWLTALFASLWLVTLLLWWRGKRNAGAVRVAPSAATTSSEKTPKANQKALLDACKHHDANAAREQLLQLTGASSLGALAAQHDEAIASVVMALNEALYGPPPQRWQGDALAAVLPRLLQPNKTAGKNSNSADLPPLYPAS
jgi:hypothetical protein